MPSAPFCLQGSNGLGTLYIVCVCVCVRVCKEAVKEAGRYRPDFPDVAGVWECADCRFVLLQASGPALLPEAVPVAGIDFGLGSSPVLAPQKGA